MKNSTEYFYNLIYPQRLTQSIQLFLYQCYQIRIKYFFQFSYTNQSVFPFSVLKISTIFLTLQIYTLIDYCGQFLVTLSSSFLLNMLSYTLVEDLKDIRIIVSYINHILFYILLLRFIIFTQINFNSSNTLFKEKFITSFYQ